MPINETVQGNLITLAQEGKFCAIVQGCNCFNAMGAGLAPQIAKAWPGAEAVDSATVRGDHEKLGKLTYYTDDSLGLLVVNGYTQYSTGGRAKGLPDIDYKAVADVFFILNRSSHLQSGTVGIPQIGAGLAGGHWEAIETIINLVTPNLDITLVEYEPYKPFHPLTNAQLNVIVGRWHDGHYLVDQSLRKVLGMTEGEYIQWSTKPSINLRRT